LEYFPAEVEDEDEAQEKPLPFQEQRNALGGVFEPPSMTDLSLNDSKFVGFNGRSNKRADTCYAFWVAASLAVCFPC
jgi:geranylgeranyl transferase type-1 subunit beta